MFHLQEMSQLLKLAHHVPSAYVQSQPVNRDLWQRPSLPSAGQGGGSQSLPPPTPKVQTFEMFSLKRTFNTAFGSTDNHTRLGSGGTPCKNLLI